VPPDPAVVGAVLRATPGAAHVSGVAESTAGVAGLTSSVTLTGYEGDSVWTGYRLISGDWYRNADEAVVPSNLLTTAGRRVGDTIVLQAGDRQRTLRITGEIFDVDNAGLRVITDATVVLALDPDASVRRFEVGLSPGADPSRYVSAVNGRLAGSFAIAYEESGADETVTLFLALIIMLVLLVCAVAALGVFNTTLLNTREQVRDIGILKALGMTPRQVRLMVVSALAGVGVAAGSVAVPVGIVLHGQVLQAMAHAGATNLPVQYTAVFHPAGLAVLGLAGLVIAVLGALVPAGWASVSRPATALRSE
jgi:putative ABC transport system permease protein